MSGNEPQIRSVLNNIDELIGNLDDHKQDITDALDGINQLAGALADRERQIGNVLRNLPPASPCSTNSDSSWSPCSTR